MCGDVGVCDVGLVGDGCDGSVVVGLVVSGLGGWSGYEC